MIRLSGAFVTRFYEEWDAAGSAMLHSNRNDITEGERHQRVERVLDAMKYRIAEVIFPEVLPHAKVTVQNNSPSRAISLDKDSRLS